jgi:hypothetical protein
MSKKNHEQTTEEQTTEEQTTEEQTTEATDKAAIFKAKKLEANKRWAEKRDAARPRVKAFLKANAEQLGDLKADIELFIGKPAGVKVAKVKGIVTSLNSELRDALIAAADAGLSEMDIFRKFKIGRPEMRIKIRTFTLTPNPDNRIWVSFDETSELYHVLATSRTPPAGWEGYVPAEKETL